MNNEERSEKSIQTDIKVQGKRRASPSQNDSCNRIAISKQISEPEVISISQDSSETPMAGGTFRILKLGSQESSQHKDSEGSGRHFEAQQIIEEQPSKTENRPQQANNEHRLDAGPPERQESAEVACNCRPKVMVVDDNQFNILALKSTILDNFDAEVDEASNGEIAVDKFVQMFNQDCGCQNRVYRLIFMDIQMPVMDGIEATKRIFEFLRTQQRQALTQIVAVTAYTDEQTKSACLSAGMKAIYNKPMPFASLHRTMWLDCFRIEASEYPAVYREHFGKSPSIE